MSRTLKLICLIWPDADTEAIDEVEINGSENLINLRQMIKRVYDPRLRDVDASDLELWKCSIPLEGLDEKLPPIDYGATNSNTHDKLGIQRLDDYFVRLSSIFVDDPTEHHVHILVRLPHDEGEAEEKQEPRDKLTELVETTHKRYKGTIEKHLNAPVAKSRGYTNVQSRDFHDGRYLVDAPAETRAPPIQLFHEVFARFLDDLEDKNLEVPTELVRATCIFMGKASGIYKNEDARRAAIRLNLLNLLSVAIGELGNLDWTAGDILVIARSSETGDVAATCIIPGENELISDGGSDPSARAGSSYGRFWTQPNHTRIRENSCCPTFLVAIAGGSMSILGAVWTDKIIVQHLTDYISLAHDAIFNNNAVYRTAHILHALVRSIHRLDAFYHSLKTRPQSHAQPTNTIHKTLGPRYFPSVNAYRGPDGEIVNFTFVVPLEPDPTCTTFLAKTEGPTSEHEHVVVKFVHRYNKPAHELLASHGMAPALRYCDKIGIREGDPSYGDLLMIVMDFVDGEMADKFKAQALPATFREQIRNAVTLLHRADFVFGDLRAPNVMITKDGRVLLIDFDMVGVHGVSRYPIMMSPSIQWPPGVGAGLGVMMKEHDEEMLSRLVPGMGF
ncbi:hypothetical protein H0H81_010681 [Sphagnurus paluster]|uniref:Protein kinase domain-containing protein n=1 Tax=Sphagnurus paluster TaxID=117069 RepID=A0A9P7KKS7_9AGAR|nr:hypothetical protein H0H81_010681 [Sphagnurus paluster]